MMQKIVGAIIVFIIVIAFASAIYHNNTPIPSNEIDDELYIDHEEFDVPIVEPIASGCYVGGCSSQICSDDPDVITTCEFREEYACYRTATCERQATGQCGWTPTDELNQCLREAETNVEMQLELAL